MSMNLLVSSVRLGRGQAICHLAQLPKLSLRAFSTSTTARAAVSGLAQYRWYVKLGDSVG
jgi:hypothetical protein